MTDRNDSAVPALRRLARNIWVTFRPHFFPISGAAGFTGIALAYASPPLWITITIGMICFFSYGLIQALCDTFDLETDRINAPFRPLVSGALSVRTLWIVLGSLLTGVAILFVLINPLLLILQFIALIFSFSYNRMKRIPHAGPLWNGVIVATLPLIGATAVSGTRSLLELPLPVYLCAVLFCIVYAGFVLTGYFKDVTGDRATGYRTSPVVYGPRKTRWEVPAYVIVGTLGMASLPMVSPDSWHTAPAGGREVFSLLGVLAVGLLLTGNVLLIRDFSEKGAYPSLLWYTRGMLLYLLAPAALASPATAIGVTLVLVGILEYFLRHTRGTGQA